MYLNIPHALWKKFRFCGGLDAPNWVISEIAYVDKTVCNWAIILFIFNVHVCINKMNGNMECLLQSKKDFKKLLDLVVKKLLTDEEIDDIEVFSSNLI